VRGTALILLLFALLGLGCGREPPLQAPVVAPLPEGVPSLAEATQAAVAEAVVPVVLAVREVVAPLAPEPLQQEDLVHPAAVDLIVQFEIVSPTYYERRLQGVICPGGASGPTWGVGYDGGHQAPSVIQSDWAEHSAVDRLVTTAGVIGPERCRASSAALAGVRTPLGMAHEVFAIRTLPRYHNEARRVFRNGWEMLPRRTQGSLVSVVFNRGSAMTGDRRREMRHIRDVCVPAADTACIAQQIRASTRLWVGRDIETGMRRRREAEAQLAESTDEVMR